MRPSGTPAALRQGNAARVLATFREASRDLRVAEVAELTGLSRPTVEAVTEALLAQRWVEESDRLADELPRTTGRPARRYRFNERAGFVVGVDVGPHSVTACVADLLGNVLRQDRSSARSPVTAETLVAVSQQVVSSSLAATGISPHAVLALTVGTPGVVDRHRNRVAKVTGIRGWADIDVASDLSQGPRCRVVVENDANLAAIGERAAGIARGCSDLLYLLLGERLGAGVISNGRLVHGADGAAGEVGFVSLTARPTDERGFGPLESLVNAEAVVALAKAAMERTRSSVLWDLADGRPSRLSAQDVAAAASSGDVAALGVFRKIGKLLARGVAPAVLILNPKMVVLGGGISGAGRILVESIEPHLSKLTLFVPRIELSALGRDAVVRGAVYRSLEVVETTVFRRVSG